MSRLLQNHQCDTKQNEGQSMSQAYDEQFHERWRYLYKTQFMNLQDKANSLFFEWLEALSLPKTHIPLLDKVSKRLIRETGW